MRVDFSFLTFGVATKCTPIGYALVDVLESLDEPEAAPAGRVAGAVRLALPVAELSQGNVGRSGRRSTRHPT
jgi:hypothetical protein